MPYVQRDNDGNIIAITGVNTDEYVDGPVEIYTPKTPTLVKAEARRRILARYPDWKQTNMVARGVELLDIWRVNGRWTAEEQAERDALDAAWAWIKSVRSASNDIEERLTDDFASDAKWPD